KTSRLPIYTHVKIEAHDVRAAMRHRQGDIPCAAANVQRAIPRRWLSKLNKAPLPITVQSEALEIIDEIIMRRDFGEEIVDLFCAMFAGLKECVGHDEQACAHSLSYSWSKRCGWAPNRYRKVTH